MKQIGLSILILFFFINPVKSQHWVINGINVTPDSVVDINECLDFIHDVTGQTLLQSDLILKNDPQVFQPLNCFEQILKDDYYLKKEEWKNVVDQKIPQLFQWSLKYISASSKKNSITPKTDTTNQLMSWPYFYQRVSKKGIVDQVHYYGIPIFLRTSEKFKYCIFYSRNECGGNCGDAAFSIYINNDGHWLKLKTYCGWII